MSSSGVAIHLFMISSPLCFAPCKLPALLALITSVRAIVSLRFGIICSRYNLPMSSAIESFCSSIAKLRLNFPIGLPSANPSTIIFFSFFFVVSSISTTSSATDFAIKLLTASSNTLNFVTCLIRFT